MSRSSAGVKLFQTLEQRRFPFLQESPWSPHDPFIEGVTMDQGNTGKAKLQNTLSNNNTCQLIWLIVAGLVIASIEESKILFKIQKLKT